MGASSASGFHPAHPTRGVPLGSALWHYHQTLRLPRQYELTHAYQGTEYSSDAIADALDRAGLRYERLAATELIERVADDLAADKIVGWFQGRFEIGPRALGNRSILASPLRAAIRETLNARVKFREPFRPFAPAVLVEHATRYFELSQPDPFMTVAVRVRPEKANEIPAAVHVASRWGPSGSTYRASFCAGSCEIARIGKNLRYHHPGDTSFAIQLAKLLIRHELRRCCRL
jgi:carbamoyltransferase